MSKKNSPEQIADRASRRNQAWNAAIEMGLTSHVDVNPCDFWAQWLSGVVESLLQSNDCDPSWGWECSRAQASKLRREFGDERAEQIAEKAGFTLPVI